MSRDDLFQSIAADIFVRLVTRDPEQLVDRPLAADISIEAANIFLERLAKDDQLGD